MAKRIILKDASGNPYTLEFNRETVERMQRGGFVLDTDRLFMSAKDLIAGAFRMHHRKLDWEHIEPVWMCQNRRDELLKTLAEMYMEPTLTLMGTENTEADSLDPTWTVEE